MKLIDKDKIIAEIERLRKEDGNPYFQSETADKYYARGVHFTCDRLVNFLNTLEVKEVNLEKNNVIGTLERVVKIDAGGYPCIDCYIEFYDYDKDIPLAKEGDKVKIIVVKEEKL